MGLFSSLYTGAAGLLAQQNSTSVISENIANMTTVGYKRQDVAFHDLVAQNRQSDERFGSVTSTRINRIDNQGTIRQTTSATDLSINGRGFFIVRDPASPPEDPYLYTRNGLFQEDANGILRNSSGHILYGWDIDENGNILSGTDTSNLVPIDVDAIATSLRPTTQGEVRINLDAQEPPFDLHTIGAGQTLPANGVDATFSRSLTVYDSNGEARLVNFEFRPVVGPMAHFTSNTAVLQNSDTLVDPGSPTPGISAGETLQITSGGNTLNINFVAGPANTAANEANTVGDVINVINNFAPGGTRQFTASLTSQGRLLVQANDPAATLNISGSSADVLGPSGFNFVPDPASGTNVYPPEASITGNSPAYPGQTDFPALANTATPNVFNWWEVRTTHQEIQTIGGVPTPVTIENGRGLVNFNGDGSLNAAVDANGQSLLDLGTLSFNNADATDNITLTVNIAGLTQFGGGYNALSLDQNGAPLGELSRIEIGEDGIVTSIFTNGQRLETFQIPVADFTNVNGLRRVSGTTFAQTADAGTLTVGATGTEGNGVLQASTLEDSNVDLANEFGNLIVNQRAFGLNSRVINTVDEMTQRLSQLKQ